MVSFWSIQNKITKKPALPRPVLPSKCVHLYVLDEQKGMTGNNE